MRAADVQGRASPSRGGMSSIASVLGVRLHGPGDVRVEPVEVPELVPGTVRVRVAWSGICGTDLHAYRSGGTGLDLPAVLGHEVAGRVEATSDPDRWPEGTRVAVDPAFACGMCLQCREERTNLCQRIRICGFDAPGGLAELVRVPTGNLLPLPDSLQLRTAASVEPVGCAVHAVRRAALQQGVGAVVIGAGAIGLGVASVALALGADPVVVAEPVEARRRMAERTGASVVDAGETVERVREAFGGGAPVVVEASGSKSGLRLALACAARGSRVVVVGIHAGKFWLDANWAFGAELSLLWSLGALRSDLERAVDLLAAGSVLPHVWTEAVALVDVGPGLFDRMATGAVARPLVRFDDHLKPAGDLG